VQERKFSCGYTLESVVPCGYTLACKYFPHAFVLCRLLQDASFFGHHQIMRSLRTAALTCTAEWVSFAIEDVNVDGEIPLTHSERFVGAKSLWERLNAIDIAELTSSPFRFDIKLKFASADRELSAAAKISQAVVSLQILNGIHLPPFIDFVDIIESALRLDIMSGWLFSVADIVKTPVCILMGTIRAFIANILECLTSMPILQSQTQIVSMITTVFKTANSFVAFEAYNGAGLQLLKGSIKLFRALLQHLLAIDEAEELGSDGLLCQCFRVLFSAENIKSYDTRIVAMFGRATCGHLMSESARIAFDRRNSTAFAVIGDYLWDVVISMYDEETTDSPELWLLFGQLLIFSCQFALASPPIYSVKILTLSHKCIELLGVSFDPSVAYAVASLAKVCSEKVALEIMNQIISIDRDHSLLNATFCSLALRLDAANMTHTFQTLVDAAGDQTKNKAHSMRLMELTLIASQQSEFKDVWNVFGARFFTVALSALGVADNVDRDCDVLASCSLLQRLLSSRDVITLEVDDLARLLSEISVAVGCGISVKRAKPLSGKVYAACTELFLLTFQRYTKYLYGCVPLVVCVLHCLLERALHDELSEVETAHRGQRFTRVCEVLVPHKDVYKKHLIGLVLVYIRSVCNDLSSAKKVSILPAVFYLLDSLTTYETKQLNALMDTRDRVIFRFIYQSYQKMHSYKGQ
jgi:hypothetical protein